MVDFQENKLEVHSDVEDLKSSPLEDTLNQIFKMGKHSKDIEKLKTNTKSLMAERVQGNKVS